MRGVIFAAVAALTSLTSAQGQSLVQVNEDQIRAVLKDASTTISVPVESKSDHSIRAQLSLDWLDKDDRPIASSREDVAVNTGQNTFEIPLRISESSLWLRLRYSLAPAREEVRAFATQYGTVAISQIAGYVFEVKIGQAGFARSGNRLTVHGQAVHPVTGMPVSGVEWRAALTLDQTNVDPARLTVYPEGFVEIEFDIPADLSASEDEDAEVWVQAKRGDFASSVSANISVPNRPSARLQTDKPLYQPGQTIHLRAVVLDPQGRALHDAKVELRIEADNGERMHTAHLVASRFGVVQDDWALPVTSDLGTYRLMLNNEGDEIHEIGSHQVRVSRYELPTFRVEAKPDRGAYLPSQPAKVTITGAYLFGKPVPKGSVKVTRSDEGRWNPRTRNYEGADEAVAQGETGADGSFVASLDLTADHELLNRSDTQRFRDIHFAAYFTDADSGHTEQRSFDIRITREPIHIYLIPAAGGRSFPAPVYVSTDYADGRPAMTSVELRYQGRITALHTNQYGVGKALLPLDPEYGGEVEARAVDSRGVAGTWTERYWHSEFAYLHLETARTIYRAGESVTIKISAPQARAQNAPILLYAIAGDRAVASRIVWLVNGVAEVTLPYQPEFRRTVVFAAWNGPEGRPSGGFGNLSSKAVIFPDVSELRVSANTDGPIYRPGEKATLHMQVSTTDGKPVEAALGVAVVDQAVLERERTDSDFGRRDWFGCAYCGDDGEGEIGGIRLNDLYHLSSTTPVLPEMDLVAEALVARAGAPGWTTSGETLDNAPTFNAVSIQTQQIRLSLDRHYAETLEFPSDESSLFRILGRQWTDLRDPWGSRYTPRFMIERDQNVVLLTSAGPDKRAGTGDDFVAGTFRRSYFAPIRTLMAQILSRKEDYPASAMEIHDLFRDNGLLLDTLSDPWGTPYRADVRTQGAKRYISIFSAGPDRRFGTPDDFLAAHFLGSYFRREAAAIARALQDAPKPPQTVEEFRRVLEKEGIDISRYSDAWGKPYRLTSTISSRYSDRLNSKTVRIFGGPTTSHTDVVPVTAHWITFALRSPGEDGIEDTYDDFEVAQFPVLLLEEFATTAADGHAQSATLLHGTGAITGLVTDVTGAVIRDAKVLLIDAGGVEYETTSSGEGVYRFASVPTGIFSLRASSPGFRVYEVTRLPAMSGKTTTVDVTLEVGTATEQLTVEASGLPLQTQAAEIAGSKPAATPRVRDYFPETLLWIPELVTDVRGAARTEFTLADSVTTWKVAVVASTVGGRLAEVDHEIQSFQPFFVDFSPPPVLTEGDRLELPVAVRNYRKTEQKVALNLQPNDWSIVNGSPVKEVVVPPDSSVKVSYSIQAKTVKDAARQRIIANAGRDRDAIDRAVRVHPDGQEITQTAGDVLTKQAAFSVFVPLNAISGATRGELRLYPNVASLLLESAAAILQTPHGCAEQTISWGYANLVALRYSRQLGITNPRVEKIALSNVTVARDSLPRFEGSDGGVGYWSSEDPDVAVTAHALSFLVDASGLIAVDRDELDSLASWLERRQQPDGSWMAPAADSVIAKRQAVVLTALVAKALAAAHKAGVEVPAKTLAAAYHHIASFADQMDEPYMLAQFILAALDSGDETLLGTAAVRLKGLAREEKGGFYWDLQTNSPFYGWGTAGRIETTGVAVSALSAWRARHSESTELDPVIRRGLLFLLRARDREGNWFSTQSTLRAMQAMADASSLLGRIRSGGRIEVRINGRPVQTISMPKDPLATNPALLDMGGLLSAGDNRIEFVSSAGAQGALIQFSETHWLPWTEAPVRRSGELRISVAFDHLGGRTRQPVRCSVKAERVGFRGYGMMLAEVGLPPGADVDRASLQSLIDDRSLGVDRYDVLPDRVVLYLWPKAGGAAFDFFLSVRDGIVAKSAPSVLYDYYNPEALSEVPPFTWVIQ